MPSISKNDGESEDEETLTAKVVEVLQSEHHEEAEQLEQTKSKLRSAPSPEPASQKAGSQNAASPNAGPSENAKGVPPTSKASSARATVHDFRTRARRRRWRLLSPRIFLRASRRAVSELKDGVLNARADLEDAVERARSCFA